MGIDRTTGAAFHPEITDAAANEGNFKASPVRALVLDKGASRVERQHEAFKADELWLGSAYDPSQPAATAVPVYVRITRPAPIVAELLCSVIARALGLPAPEPFVVLVAPEALPKSPLAQAAGLHLTVATRDLGGSTFAQLLREDSHFAQALISKWHHLLPVAVLDEWLANDDRNMGNIIYIAQTLYIIDHAEAFGGSHRALFPLVDITHDTFTNKLAGLLDGDASQRQSWLNKAKEWLTFTAGGLDMQAALSVAQITRWQSDEEEAELLHFITTRLSVTHHLLCNRLGHPQLSFSSTSACRQ